MLRALVITAAVCVLSAAMGIQHVALTGNTPSVLLLLLGGGLGGGLGLGLWSLAQRSAPAAAPPRQDAGSPALVGHLAAGVAHDFNNLLTVIQIAGQVLEAEHCPESARDVLRACEEGRATVEQLMELAREQPPRILRQDLRALLKQRAPLLRAAAGSNTLRVCVPDHPCWVQVDRVLLTRALLNLVVNAREACREAVVVRLRCQGDVVELSVEDDGDGIPDELRDRIFEPFFSTKRDGSGLGLCVVRDAARALGGQLSVGRAALGGAALTLSLPHIQASLAC